ncbi:FMRFamide receptor-like [Folsomia candida]|uniref:FMRFamide receptor-like n=1 Tax=Folsomia candida TaxID=158441 RepID=UPI00160544A5|nr:FMRFamide receptor-like [Folsomia candida]
MEVSCNTRSSLRHYDGISHPVIFSSYLMLSVIGVFGIVGNILCANVLLSPSIRKFPFNVLLLHSAVWNILLLLSKILHFVSFLNLLTSDPDIPYFPELALLDFFIISVLVSVTSQMGSIVTTIMVNIDRYLSIRKMQPGISSGRSKKRVVYMIIISFVSTILYGVPFIWKYSIEQCNDANGTRDILKQNTNPFLKWYYSKFFVGIIRSFVPFIILSYLNFKLVVFIKLQTALRKTMASSHQNNNGGDIPITKIVVAISTMPLVTVIVQVVRVCVTHNFENEDQAVLNFCLKMAQHLAEMLEASLNVVFCCVWGRKFRNTFREMVSCRRKMMIAKL